MTRFKKIKRKDFVLLSTWGDFIITHIDGNLKIHNKWEYDNGLYIANGWETDPSTWKQVKELLKNKKEEKIIILINNGRCPRCGCKLTPKNYKNEIENSLDIPFEYDFSIVTHASKNKFKTSRGLWRIMTSRRIYDEKRKNNCCF